MAERCPWCGLVALPDVATHIAMTEVCAHEQMVAVLWPQDLESKSEEDQ